MKLQILIPQYTEDETIIKPLLDSIEIQQSVDLANDIGAIIVNDGSDVHLSREFLDSYSFPIEYHLHEHRGVSATRNACLDYATAEYVMFCDADDMFFNACGLWIIFREIEKKFDSMVSIFTEEVKSRETGKITYLNHERDSVFVHGKVHRRAYLIEKNIRWNESLTIHEDSYFNTLCQVLSQNVIYLASPFFLWKWRDNSICRHDKKYILKTYRNLIDSNDALVQELLDRGMKDKAEMFVATNVFNSYYTMNKEEWINQENKEYRDMTEERFTEYYRKYKDIWDGMPNETKMKISTVVRNRMVIEGMPMESITIDEWLKRR